MQGGQVTYPPCVQLNLSTTATFGTEERAVVEKQFKEVSQCMDCPLKKSGPCAEVAVSGGSTALLHNPLAF